MYDIFLQVSIFIGNDFTLQNLESHLLEVEIHKGVTFGDPKMCTYRSMKNHRTCAINTNLKR